MGTGKLKKSPKIESIAVNEDGQMCIRWTKVKTAQRYAVQRSTDPDGKFKKLAWIKGREYVDETAEKDVTYWYKVVAWKKIGVKKVSKKSSGLKAGVVSDIPAPEKARLTSSKRPEIRLSWKNPKGVDGCIVSRRNDFYKQLLPIETVEGNSFKDSEIVTGQPYHYALQYFIKDAEGIRHGNFSEEFDCIHLDSGEILRGKKSLFGKVKLSLRLVAGAQGYIVYVGSSEDGEYTEVLRTKDAYDLRVKCKSDGGIRSRYYRVAAFRVLGDEEFISVMSRAVKL